MPKKTDKYYSQDDLSYIMNTTGALSETSDLSESEDEEQEDSIEFEVLYDSDVDQEYVTETSDVESDDLSDTDIPRRPSARKKPMTHVNPFQKQCYPYVCCHPCCPKNK